MQATKLIRKSKAEIKQLTLQELEEEFKYVNTVHRGKHQGKRKSRVYKDKLYTHKLMLIKVQELLLNESK